MADPTQEGNDGGGPDDASANSGVKALLTEAEDGIGPKAPSKRKAPLHRAMTSAASRRMARRAASTATDSSEGDPPATPK